MITPGAVSVVPLSEKLRRVEVMDLEPIKFKLVHDHEPSWTIERVDRVEVEYKRFLTLVLKNQVDKKVESVVPTKEVDEFWHAHILDTAKYAADCEFCLGFFLHHFPYLGLRGPEDAQVLKGRFAETRAYYEAEFGILAEIESAGAGTGCDTSDCAPEPSCSGEGDPKFTDFARPVLARV